MHANTPRMQHLLWLLFALSCTYGLHAFNLHYWIPAAFALLAVWRYLIEKMQWPFPPLWVRLPITILGGVAVLATYGSLFGRDASVALFAVMISLKLLETRTSRDYIVMIILGYFLTINTLLFSQAIWVSLAILVPMTGLTACLIAISHVRQSDAMEYTWRFQAQLAGKLLLQSLPIMLVLFILFPRIPGPIWGIPHDAYKGMSGLSDSMEFGSISDLSLSSKVAFRAEFHSEIPDNSALYWRGPVLWHQEGRRWRMTSENLPLNQESVQALGSPTDYTITLEPHNKNWLLLLDMPTALPPETYAKHDLQVLSRQPIRTRIRYSAQAHTQYKLGETLGERERTMALQLLEDENPRTLQLATQWAKEYSAPLDIVNAALRMYREQPFIYTLAPPRLGENPVDAFLFNTRRGFCEHYASSFVYLMRAAGVPARVVTGYQGGEINPNGNYLIVRQSDAHAWAEVWLENRGWIRIDPTSAVAPSRIEQGISSAVDDADLLPILSRQDYPLLKQLYLNWDTINNGWNQWVLGYDQQKQLSLLAKIFGKKVAWGDIGLILMSVLIILMLVISYLLLRSKKVRLDPARKSYQQFLNKLGKIGLVKAPHEGVIEFGQRAAQDLPGKAWEIIEISRLYSALQYARPSIPNHQNMFETLKQLIKNFKSK
jgi:protein-glutamine gamma-glutamyltransferase